jgi:hypothetical protein
MDFTKALTAQYMIPTGAREWTGIKVQALIGFFCDAFVNIKVTTPIGCAATVDVLVFQYVVTLTICVATMNITTYRFSEPPHDKAELRITQGYIPLDMVVSTSVEYLLSV